MTTAPRPTATAPPSRTALAYVSDRLAPHHIALAGVLALSGLLDLNRLSQNGYGNIFYSAGVKSMLGSLHNFFFVSFDPGGLLMVDKPPLGLWLQTASAKAFGYKPLSLLLPEAILGMLAVLLLYRLLVPRIGGWAAVAGALALAIFPSFVAISRTNNVDALLIVLMILACGAALRACETGHWRTLLWSGALIGLAFNTKTLAAYLVVPGIALGYLICAPGTLPRRLTQLVAAGALMVVVSFSWMAVVELTPASERPFVGSSTDNTELGLTFSYNGFGRVEGQVGGPGQVPVGTGGLAHAPSATTGASGKSKHVAKAPAPKPPAILPNGRERNPVAFGRGVGPARLFGKGLNDQGAWLLPLALIGLLAFALEIVSDQRSQGRDRHNRRLALALVLGGWFVVEVLVLSLSKGIVHPYYVSALGPGVAAMVGGGVFAFAQLAKRRSWLLLLLPCAVTATVATQLALLHDAHYMSWYTAPLIVAALVGVCALAVRRTALAAIAALVVLLAIAPAVYSASNSLAPVQSTFPAAGPRKAAGPSGGYGVNRAHIDVYRALIRYVEGHGATPRWIVLVDAANTGSPMILLDAHAGSLGGFSGTDPVLDGAGLARLVSLGQARYVLLGGQFSLRGGTASTRAVQRACVPLSTRTWLPKPLDPYNLALYDCAGRERALAAA